VTHDDCELLKVDPRFDEAFRRWAAQRFPSDLVDDAIQEAWCRVLRAPLAPDMAQDEYLRHYAIVGIHGINSYWWRWYRGIRSAAGRPVGKGRKRAKYMRDYRHRLMERNRKGV
jgi:hypothetical protein